MSGSEAIRGFAVQTLICLLDSLWATKEWKSVTLEPHSENEKVDILWEYIDETTLAQQVKSSKNQISKSDAMAWCKELKESHSANKYQLILAGPIAASVLNDAPFHDVEVPTPTSMDMFALLDQAVTKIDRYLTQKSIAPIPLPLRESLIYELVSRMLQASICSKRIPREEFDGWLLSTITASYPEAVSQRLTSNCAVLWNVMEIAGPLQASESAFELILPLTVVNGGGCTAVVEMFLLRVCSSLPNRKMLYRPQSVLPENSNIDYVTRRYSGRPFEDFAITPHSSVQQFIVFVPVEGGGYETGSWSKGDYEIELFVKYVAQTAISSIKREKITIIEDDFSVVVSSQTRFITFSNLDKYLDLI